MRTCSSFRTLIPCLVIAVTGLSWAGPPAPPPDVEELVRQLGDDAFAKREAASRALAAIGDPALTALRQAARDEDVEIRRRAEVLINTLNERAAAEDQKRLEGAWALLAQEDNGRERPLQGRVVFTGGSGVGWDASGLELFRCTWRVVDATTSPKKVDLVKPDGQTFHAIYAFDGDTLKYCGSFDRRPQSFETRAGDGFCRATLLRSVPQKATKAVTASSVE